MDQRNAYNSWKMLGRVSNAENEEANFFVVNFVIFCCWGGGAAIANASSASVSKGYFFLYLYHIFNNTIITDTAKLPMATGITSGTIEAENVNLHREEGDIDCVINLLDLTFRLFYSCFVFSRTT